MPKDATELLIAKGGSIYVAPVGTAAPTTPTGATPGFIDLGYATEDGVTLQVTPEIQEFGAWQSRVPLRRELNAQEIMLSTSLEQWSAQTVTLAFGGGAVDSPSAGVYRYSFPTSDDTLDERALLVEWKDGSRNFRLIVPKGNVTEPVSSQLVKNALGVLPIGFKALGVAGVSPATLLTDDPTFGVAS